MLTISSHFSSPFPSLKSFSGCKLDLIEVKNKRKITYKSPLPQVSMTTSTSSEDAPSIRRRSADFPPNTWEKNFMSYASSDSEENSGDAAKHAQKLKDEVKKMLTSHVTEPAEKLELIDLIQRVGLSYHFACEINQALRHTCSNFNNKDGLHVTAVRFRLLRQQGYNVSCDVFNRFKDHKGNFHKSLVNDPQGLLSLYEASHLRVHGEEVLDEALDFTTTNLKFVVASQSPTIAARITHALNWPIHTGMPRVNARQYLSLYQANSSSERLVLELAKIDFNSLQKLHKREVGELMEWRNKCSFIKKLPFARERTVESYFWMLGVYFEPQYSLGRKIMTKVCDFIGLIDDIFDVYGTYEELVVFTEAVDRWDIGNINILPQYMRHCYQALLDFYSEVEKDMDLAGKQYRTYYAKEAMKRQVKAYIEEAKWLHHQHIPTLEEYLEVASITAGYTLLTIASFLGMGNIATEDAFEWILSRPKIIRASELIIRLTNDIVSHKFEQRRGHIPSSVECYMKQYGVTEEKAISELQRQLTNAWKDINQECLGPTPFPMPLLARVLNLSRSACTFYKEEDAYTNCESSLKDIIASLIVDPVVI